MPVLDSHVFDITRAIQLAVAPVFLLTAIGTLINALTGRLGRAVDRRRKLEELLSELEMSLADGDLEGARSALEAAEEMAGPEDPDVRYGRALIAQETGDVDTAMSELKLALEVDPEYLDQVVSWH